MTVDYLNQNPGYTDHRKMGVAGSGEPPHDGGMEARVAKLESDVGHIMADTADIKADIRELRGVVRHNLFWTIGGFAAMLLVMAHGFGWI